MQMQAMQVLSRSQEVTADNLANINTPGFKGNKVFYNLLKETINGKEVSKSVPMQHINLDQGILEPTGNQFDLAINGDGFFMVEEDGERFLTRDGRFHLSADGNLVNSSGAQVQGDAGPIQLSELLQTKDEHGGAITLEIAKDGTVRVNDSVIDKIQVMKVEDPSDLTRKGNTYFTVENEDLLSDEETGTVMQGYFEKGNVQPLNEMVDMMRSSQMFESQQRAMKTTDEMLSSVTTTLGRF
tara:strand:+ start:222406 stop:223128 length:723 start_codon:yes stop_codon:yes gene_type:complete